MPNQLTQALLAAVANSTEPMVLSDPHAPDHPIIAANPAFAIMTGYPMAEIVGRNCRFLQGAGTDRKTAQRLRSAIEAEEGCIEWIVNHRRDGSAFWNLLFLVPIRDRDGRLLHYFGNQLDITRGFPDWLGEVTFGRAHLTRENGAEFQHLLLDIMEDQSASEEGGPAQARALERIIAASRRLAELSTTLAAGAKPEIPALT